MDSLVGRTLGSYQILEQIGMGGMATIYRAYQSSMDRYVAVKVLPQQMAADDATFLGRFEQEAKTIAKLEHRNILPVYDYGEDEGYTYLVMRYVDAGTFKDLIEEGAVPVSRAVRLVQQVAEALDYAHQQGVIHRDIKPSNVMLDSQDHVYLMDFGIAKLLSSSARFTGTDMMIGTPAYMSPEQAQGEPADARSDIYSLGVMLYEMVTGQAPYEAETPMAVMLKHIQAPLPPPRTIRHDLPNALERIILKTMAKRPEARYQTATDLVADLEGALMKAPTEQVAATKAGPGVEETVVGVSSAAEPTPAEVRKIAAGVWFAVGVVLFGIVMVALVLLSNASGIPGAGTPVIDVAATAAEQTAAAAGAMLPPASESPPTAVAAAGTAPVAGPWTYEVSTAGTWDLLPVGDEVYAATSGGLVRWTMDGQGTPITPAQGLPLLRVNALAAAPDGSFWLGGQLTGIVRVTLDGDQAGDAAIFTVEDGLSSPVVNDLWIDAETGGIWAAMGYGGLEYYNGQDWRAGPPVPMGRQAAEALGDHVYVVTRTSDGALWVGGERGLARLGPDADSWQFLPQGGTEDPVQVIYEDRDGNLFIAAGGRLWRTPLADIGPDSWELLTNINQGCFINGMLQATDGAYWFTCEDYVVRAADGRRTAYTFQDGLPGYPTGAILEDAMGRLWVGTDYGIGVFDGRRWITFRRENEPQQGQMAFLQVAGDGAIWAANGYWWPAAWRYDLASGAWDVFDFDPLQWGGIHDLAVDVSGDVPLLWVASFEGGLGLYRTDDGRSRTYGFEEGLDVSFPPEALALDGAGHLWIGTLDGIYRMDMAEETFTLYEEASAGDPLDRITHLYVDPAGTLWAGHRGWEPSEIASVADRQISATLEMIVTLAESVEQSELVDEDALNDALVAVFGGADELWESMEGLWDADGDAREPAAETVNEHLGDVDEAVEALAALVSANDAAESDAVRELVDQMQDLAEELPDPVQQFVEARLSGWEPGANYIYRYDAAADAFELLDGADSPSSSEDPYLADMTTDGAGGLLVAISYDSLYHFDGDAWTREEGSLEGQQLSAVAVLSSGRRWVASPNTGLFTEDEFGWLLQPWQDGLGTTQVSDLLAAADGSLWIGTEGGLIRWQETD